jgi:hypothetical protein
MNIRGYSWAGTPTSDFDRWAGVSCHPLFETSKRGGFFRGTSHKSGPIAGDDRSSSRKELI